MKRALIFICVIFLLGTWNLSFGQNCTALFNIASLNGTTVEFNNTSISNNPVGQLPDFVWTFGDGESSEDINATYTFPWAGTYTVCLTLTDPITSCTDTYCESIAVGILNCNSYSIEITPGIPTSTLEIYNPSDFGAYYPDNVIWYDGVMAVGNTPVLTYQTPNVGPYSVCIEYEVEGQVCSQCVDFDVEDPTVCPVEFTYTTDPNNLGIFNVPNPSPTGGGYGNVQWVFTSPSGNEEFGTGEVFTYIFQEGGDYEVCVTADLLDENNVYVCTGTSCQTVSSLPNGCGYAITTNANGLDLDVELLLAPGALNPTLVEWYIDGQSTSFGTGIQSSITFSQSGTYNVCAYYEVAGTNCTGTICEAITVTGSNSICEANVEASIQEEVGVFSLVSSAGNNVIYNNVEWWIQGPDGNLTVGNGNVYTFVFAIEGDYTVCATTDVFDMDGNFVCTIDACSVITYSFENCDYTIDIDLAGEVAVVSLINPDGSLVIDAIEWALDGQGVIGSGNPFTYTLVGTGTYTFCAQFMDPSSPCPSTCQSIDFIDPNEVCVLDIEYEINFDSVGVFTVPDLSGLNYFLQNMNWQVVATPSNLVIGTGMGDPFTYVFPGPGIYEVTYVGEVYDNVNNFICTSTNTIIIEISNSLCDMAFSGTYSGLTGVFEVFGTESNTTVANLTWFYEGMGFSGNGGGATPFTVDFPTNGTYELCMFGDLLDNNNQYFCSFEYCEMVTVGSSTDPCQAFFEYSDSGVPGSYQMVFENQSVGPFSNVLWDFGDGSTSTDAASILIHDYAIPGAYTVCLTVWEPVINCEDTYCEIVYVTGSPNCNFAMSYTQSDETIVAQIASPDGNVPNVIEWYIDGVGTNIGNNYILTYTFATSGVYTLCVDYEIPGTNCSGTICEEITISGPCDNTDCVWPGDTDYNQISDNFDVLPIGLAFGTNGISRNNPSINWYGQPATDWGVTSADNIDYKHMDTNGDGAIDFDDLDAVQLNYNRTHNGSQATNFVNNPDIYIDFELDTLYLDASSTSVQVNANIYVGTSNMPIDELYGLAFSIHYPADMVEPGSVMANYSSNWFGNSNDILQLEKIIPNQNVIDFAYSRTNQMNIMGAGQVATCSFVITDNLIGFQQMQEFFFNLTISDIKAIKANGEEVYLDGIGATSVVILDSTTNTEESILEWIEVFPNPASEYLHLSYLPQGENTIKLYNALGQVVLDYQSIDSFEKINVAYIPSGIYFLSIENGQYQTSRKIKIE